MIRLFPTSVLCAFLCLAISTEAQALYVTSNGDLQLEDPVGANVGVGPALLNITQVAGGSHAYTNFVGINANGELEIRSVTAEFIGSATPGGFNPTVFGDDSVIAFSATRGVITGFIGGAPVIRVDEGRLYLAQAGASLSEDPSTWATAFATGVFAEYVLGPRETVISGATLGLLAGSPGTPIPASLINVQTPNSLDPSAAQQRLVFLEDSTAAQNAIALVDPTLEGGGDVVDVFLGGNNFLSNVDSSANPDFVKVAEGFLIDVDTTILDETYASWGLNLADLAVLNAIATAAGLGNLGGAGTGFATTGENPLVLTDYSPTGGIGPNFNGDAISEFGSNNYIIYQAAPEPSSIALLSVGLVGLALAYRRRKTAQV